MEQRALEGVRVLIADTKAETGIAAGEEAERIINETIGRQGSVRLVIGAANSQVEVIGRLASSGTVDWSKVEVFHMDEYVGISASHSASFRRWIDEHLVDLVSPGMVHYLKGDAPDMEEEACRYAKLIDEKPLDVVLLGFGENGHIAFNEPDVADFQDRYTVKIVALDEVSRKQQVGEGHFANLAEVPMHALTLTCPALFSGNNWIVTVPERRKAEAVRRAFADPISEDCPATLVRRHQRVAVFLDLDSASLLEP
ncbi:MAG: 6-phosphogluconolactonase [Alkalispirochaeta sp.]